MEKVTLVVECPECQEAVEISEIKGPKTQTKPDTRCEVCSEHIEHGAFLVIRRAPKDEE